MTRFPLFTKSKLFNSSLLTAVGASIVGAVALPALIPTGLAVVGSFGLSAIAGSSIYGVKKGVEFLKKSWSSSQEQSPEQVAYTPKIQSKLKNIQKKNKELNKEVYELSRKVYLSPKVNEKMAAIKTLNLEKPRIQKPAKLSERLKQASRLKEILQKENVLLNEVLADIHQLIDEQLNPPYEDIEFTPSDGENNLDFFNDSSTSHYNFGHNLNPILTESAPKSVSTHRALNSTYSRDAESSRYTPNELPSLFSGIADIAPAPNTAPTGRADVQSPTLSTTAHTSHRTPPYPPTQDQIEKLNKQYCQKVHNQYNHLIKIGQATLEGKRDKHGNAVSYSLKPSFKKCRNTHLKSYRHYLNAMDSTQTQNKADFIQDNDQAFDHYMQNNSFNHRIKQTVAPYPPVLPPRLSRNNRG